MRKVLISTSSFAQVSPEPLERLESAGFEVRLNPTGRKLKPDELVPLLADIDGLIAGTEPLTRETLERAPRLGIVSRCGVGLDSVDLNAARDLGIRVTNTPESHVNAVAELALGGTLDVLRRISAADRALRRGEWHKPMGSLLRGKTVGIVGLGRVGKALIRLLGPFDVEILAFDLTRDDTFAAAHGVRYLPLEKLLPMADVMTLHLPFTPQLHHFLDRPKLELCKAGAVLVNCARGGLVDEQALHDLLTSGHLAGAFVDVFEREPYDGPLRDLDQVVLTPHIGSYAAEGRQDMELRAVDNLLEFFAEERPS